ncbi:hypothetical protein E2C01_044560 [Portunus trituberculatus]|uniref:Uncharacterized protein n=1 Tax=Portunus trituberculatus TaxID=210409 RepID=A0A5B7FSG8_PORTR|nr:hypothetical protein [Portunus trituberculatus]
MSLQLKRSTSSSSLSRLQLVSDMSSQANYLASSSFARLQDHLVLAQPFVTLQPPLPAFKSLDHYPRSPSTWPVIHEHRRTAHCWLGSTTASQRHTTLPLHNIIVNYQHFDHNLFEIILQLLLTSTDISQIDFQDNWRPFSLQVFYR